MKKFISSIFILMTMFFLTGCSQADKPAIIFNQRPITTQNVMDMSSVFQPNTRIYYLILMPKTQVSRILDIQIIQKGKNEYLGYSLYMTRTIKLRDEEQKYYTDYFVINERGAYIMKAYSRDNPQKVLAQAEFYVK